MADRLADRARALLPLGTALEDRHEPTDDERAALAELAERLRNTYPYPDPRYAGQMLKPPRRGRVGGVRDGDAAQPEQPRARRRPGDGRDGARGGRRSSPRCSGCRTHLGHLTASGTIANLEALWVARELHPDRVDRLGRERPLHARARVRRPRRPPRDRAAGRARPDRPRRARGAAARAATSAPSWRRWARPRWARSTTSRAIADLCAEHGARLHVDAAYGGFFALIADGGEPGGAPRAPFAAIARADSVVVDPHKHGLQPYGCGCVLFADPGVGPALRARLAVHVLHLGRPAPGRDQPRVLARRRGGRRAVDDAARAPADARRASAATSPPRARRRGRLAAALGGRPARRARASSPSSTSSACSPADASAAAISAAAERAFDTLAAEGWHVAKLRVDTDVAAPPPPGRRGRRAGRHRPALLPAEAGARRRRAPRSRRRSPPTSTPRGSPRAAPVQPGRRLHRRRRTAATRSRSCSTATGLDDGGDAALRALDEPVRDDVRAAADATRPPTTACASSPRSPSCRSPATRRSAPATPGSRPAAADARRRDRPGVRRRPGRASAATRRRPRVRRAAAAPLGARSRRRSSSASRRSLGIERGDDRRRRVGRQRPGLGRRPARRAPTRCSRCGRRSSTSTSASSARTRRARRVAFEVRAFFPKDGATGRGPGDREPQRVARAVAARHAAARRRPTSRARAPRSAAPAACT